MADGSRGVHATAELLARPNIHRIHGDNYLYTDIFETDTHLAASTPAMVAVYVARERCKNRREPDSEADVPVWTPRVTRPIWRGGYRTRHSPDRSGAGGRTTHHKLDRCTGIPLAPRGGKRCVLCQRLPSTTTESNRPILSKRALIVHVILFDAVLRFCVSVTAGARPVGAAPVRPAASESSERATG